MSGFPTVGVTGLTVATNCEGLTDRTADQGAICSRVTVRTVFKVRGWSCANQCVLVTACTVISTGRGDQCTVIRCGGVQGVPGIAVTTCTVTTRGEVLGVGTIGGHQTTVGVVTGCTSIVVSRITGVCERRRITVTAYTTGRSNLNQ